MPKFQTSIAAGYLRSGWDKSSVIREFLSNAQDAAVQYNAVMSVEHKGSKLVIETRGEVLKRRNMCLGGGDKFGRTDTIGQFEEGMKLAAMVAAREEIPLKIFTGDEVWRPTIEPNKQFDGEEVLTFVVTSAKEYFHGVRVEIGSITASEWKAEKQKYLFLLDDETVGRVEAHGSATDVLTHPSQKGRLYVKGVFVQKMDDVAYGYDMRDAKVDRDRKMVNSWDAGYAMSAALVALASKDQKVAKNLYAQAKVGRPDGSGYSLNYADDATLNALVAEFDAEHGAGSIACSDAKYVEQLRYRGKNAAVVPDRLREAIEKKRGSAMTVLQQISATPTEVHQKGQLTVGEVQNLDMALAVVADAGYPCADIVDVVTFHEPTTLGKFKDGMILVARHSLSSLKTTVSVLVHELAHRDSRATDGTIQHTQAIEEIWEKVWAKAFGA